MLGRARVRTTSGRVYATTTRLTTSRGRLAVPARFRTRGNGPARTLDRPVHLARPGSARAGTARPRSGWLVGPYLSPGSARERPGRAAAAARDDGPQGLPGARTVLLLLR